MNNLPYLIREQWKVLFLPYDRDQVTLGVAGAGKTVMAIYRAMYLDRLINTFNNHKRVLFLTVNRDVNNDINAILKDFKNVHVDTFYNFFHNFICEHQNQINDPRFRATFPDLTRFNNSNDDLKIKATTREKDRELMLKAISNVKGIESNSTLWNKPSYEKSIIHELRWMQINGVPYDDNGDFYAHIHRIGRKSFYLSQQQRSLVYLIYKEYFRLRSNGYLNSNGKLIPKLFNFNDVYRIISYMTILPENKVDYIIIDEVQDVSPVMFKALNLIKSSECQTCVFGDLSQNIFGQRIPWKKLGINITKGTFRIFKNYRNTRPISKVAKNIVDYKHETFDLSTIDFDDNEEVGNGKDNHTFLEPVLAQKSGQLPVLINSNGCDNIIVSIMQHGIDRNESSVIICFGNQDIKIITQKLASYGIQVQNEYPNGEDRNGKIYVLSINKVKGLEFDNVILYNINSDTSSEVRDEILNFDDTLKFSEMNADEMTQYYSKLYVSVTRARRNLVMTYKGNQVPQEIMLALGNGDVNYID